MPVYRGPGGAGDATNDATVTAVQAAATSAATSATNAANSATAAATSASGASTSATNAANSATSSAGSATSSANSATASAGYATNSSLSADDSAASALEAAGYASDAFDYSVAASVSSGTASDYADSAIAASASAYAHELAAEAVLTDPDFITVLGISADIDALSPIAADISAVAAIDSDVTAVAGNATDISAVADNLVDIGVVAENEADIDTVSGISANVTTVAGISANVTTVAGNTTNINTVAGVSGNVTTVAGSIASVNTVAGNIANVNQVAADTAVINSASANATAAAASALSASGSATSASASAASASAVALGNEPVRHSVRPSLLLDFANTKQLDPRITFTRASTGTFYDGKTTVKAEQNLLPNSNLFTNTTYWSLDAITLSSATAPDGTSTASRITATATNATHALNSLNSGANAFAYVSGTTITYSVFVKKGTHDFIQIVQGGTIGAHANFNIATGTVGSVVGSGLSPSASMTEFPVGSGWYRCILTFTPSANLSTGGITVCLVASNTAARREDFNAAGTETVDVFGFQAENRSSVTAYTATTTAPITNYIPALQTATSGTARFDHNPVTGESLGLLIEEQRTNLFTYSEFQAGVSGVGVIASSTMFGADGNNVTAAAFGTDGTTTSYLYKATTSASTLYTLSVYVKMDDGGAPSFGSSSASNVANDFVFNIGSAIAPPLSYVVTHVGNNLYRVSGSVTSSATPSSAVGIVKYGSNSARTFKTTGWQLEAGAFATSYIPTVASQVTRSADSASMTGTNFSSWYNQQEGTMYAESGKTINVGGTIDYIVSANDGTTTRDIFLYRGGSSVNLFVVDSTTQANISSSFSASSTEYFKVVGTYAVNDFATSLNSSTASTDTLGTLPAVTQLMIGQPPSSTGGRRSLNGTIRKFAYYPARLSNAEIQSLTVI